jgi:hypothetical protein
LKHHIILNRSLLKFCGALLPPVLVTIFLWYTSENLVTTGQFVFALALAIVPSFAYASWKRSTDRLPLLALIAFMYWLYYAVGVFWVEPTISIKDSNVAHLLSDSSVTRATAMALLGVAALFMGTKVHLRWRLGYPDIKLNKFSVRYLRATLIVGSFIGLSQSSTYAFGEGGRQIITVLVNTIPMFAFVVLFTALLRGEAETIDKVLIAGYVGFRFVSGMSSGWLGAFVSLVIVMSLVYLSERRRLPKAVLILVAAFTLFFQVGKEEFRKEYWLIGRESDRTEKINFWINTSFDEWSQVVQNPSSATIRNALSPSLTRTSLLTQTANVIDQTPSVVPYQYGTLYYYMTITLIPRFLWPEKPSVNAANQFYQVAYGLTSEDELDQVSIAVGVLTESYINFGWVGVIGIMFIGGICLDFYQRTFLSQGAGIFLNALGIVLIPQFLAVELQLAQYLGGVLQQILLTIVVMLPIIYFRHRRKELALATNPA